MNKKQNIFSVMILALITAVIFALCSGPAAISFRKILSVLFGNERGVEYAILFNVRMPRIFLAIIAGGGLSVAGIIFQAMFRNPLVEPYTLGISGGSALLAAICIVTGCQIIIPVASFTGAVLTIILIYFIVSRKTVWNMHTVLLTGVMISFVSTSLIMLIMALSKTEQLHSIVFWIMGSLEEINMNMIILTSVFVVAGVIVTYFLSGELNALTLGEEEAIHLGVNIEMIKKLLFVLASVITSSIVSITGIIGFVGLVVPHFMRILLGRDHRILIPAGFLGGALFLLLSDTAARMLISPQELPVGVVTGIAGGIIFIYFLGRKRITLGGR